MLEGTERVSNGAVSFDTQRVVDRLREGGWDEGQARALCDVLREIMRDVATKTEIRRLEEKIDIQFQAVNVRFQAMQEQFQTMQEQMKGLRQLMVIGFSIMATMMATVMAVVAVSANLLLGAN